TQGSAFLIAVFLSACGGDGRNPVAPASINTPPTIVRIEVVGYTAVGLNAQVPVRAEARDPDGDAVTCRWTSASGRVLVDSTNTCAGIYFAPGTGATDRLDVTPTDSRGLSGSVGSITVPLSPEPIAVGQPTPE